MQGERPFPFEPKENLTWLMFQANAKFYTQLSTPGQVGEESSGDQVKRVFSCPEQLNRTHCPSLGWLVALLPLTIRVFTTLQSEPRDFLNIPRLVLRASKVLDIWTDLFSVCYICVTENKHDISFRGRQLEKTFEIHSREKSNKY